MIFFIAEFLRYADLLKLNRRSTKPQSTREVLQCSKSIGNALRGASAERRTFGDWRRLRTLTLELGVWALVLLESRSRSPALLFQ